MTISVPADVISRLKAVLGEGGWSQDPERLAPKLVEWRGRWTGQTPLLALPKSTAEVSAVVGICAEAGVAITPQGGNTGLVSGQIPQGEILLSTERLRAIRDIDGFDDVIVAEAGVTLAAVHEAADAIQRRFPLGLASEGSATVGGVISTNAGYDLKQLLIGAEGTLGVITAASLKLFPVLTSRATAIVGLSSPHDAIKLLARAKDVTGGAVEAFELMGRLGVAFAIRNIPGLREPLEAEHPWYVLVETASGEPGAAEGAMERLLGRALEDGLIQDAAIAQTAAQSKAFWSVRENQSGGQKAEGAAWKHDVSVPVSRIADFIDQASAAVLALDPSLRIVAFGHVGDGNVHYDVLRAEGASDETHNERRDAGSLIVHDIVADMDGSISAEHGLGAAKTADALRYKSGVEIEALKAIRAALDPKRIMNPRVLF